MIKHSFGLIYHGVLLELGQAPAATYEKTMSHIAPYLFHTALIEPGPVEAAQYEKTYGAYCVAVFYIIGQYQAAQ